MLKFITNPSLPEARVKTVAMSKQFPGLIEALRVHDINVLEIDQDIDLPWQVSFHADLQLLHLGDENFLVSPKCSVLSKGGVFSKKPIHTTILDKNLGHCYPNDIALNFLLVNKYCIGRIDYANSQLTKLLNTYGYTSINCKQGYARCSVALVSDCAAVTADKAMSKILSSIGFDILLIDPGDIILDGYGYGFIGGCCGKISKTELVFTGTLDYFKQGKEILHFLEKHQVKPVYLQNTRLIDIGGIVPIHEQCK